MGLFSGAMINGFFLFPAALDRLRGLNSLEYFTSTYTLYTSPVWKAIEFLSGRLNWGC